MQALVWILRFAVVLVLVWFAVKNSHHVEIHGLPEQAWQLPLAFVLLVAFVAGVAIGLAAWIPTVVRQRRELSRLRRTVERIPAAAPSEPPPAAPATPVMPPPDIHGL